MSTIPDKIAERLAFFELHMPVWTKDPAAIGLTVSQLADLGSRTQNARAAFDAAQNARAFSLAATVTQSDAMASMTSLGSDLIKTIRAFAETTDNVNVYAEAQIPPPADPVPAGPPEQPTDLKANFLLPFGLGLTWKGSVSGGTIFGIWRRLEGESSYTLIANSKTKSFDDMTLPGGTSSVAYYITAYRDEFSVNSNALSVQIGAGGATSLAIAA